MLRGFYTAASGMITQQRQQEALANNIANVNTPGYKADQTAIRAFPEMLLQERGSKQIPVKYNNVDLPIQNPIGSINTGVYVQETIPNFTQGDIRQTGISTDFALIKGQVPDEAGGIFFTVQNAEGEIRYTTNGNFTVDGAGYLVTNQGYYVLDDAGNPIQTGGMDFTLTSDGILQTAEQSTQLGFSYAADVNLLTKEGDNLFSGESVAVPGTAAFQVQQGALEQSNVDSLQTMTQMMESYRLFETNQRVLRAYDESMGKAVSEIGKIG